MTSLASSRFDVHVNIRRAITCRREEALEEQIQRDGIDVGDAQRVTDRGVRRRTSTLVINIVFAAKLRDIPNGEKVARETQGPNHPELVINLTPRTHDPLGVTGAVANEGTHRSEFFEVGPAHHDPQG